MLKSIFALAFLAFIQIASASIADDVDKHHGCGAPVCCGCDTTHDKARVKVLTKTFLDLAYGGENTKRALQLATEDNEMKLQLEGCPDRSCCLLETNLADYLAEVGSPSAAYWIDEVKELRGNEFMVYTTVILSYTQDVPPHELNMRMALKWIPTIGCNHKISEIHAMSFACQTPVTNLCQNCVA